MVHAAYTILNDHFFVLASCVFCMIMRFKNSHLLYHKRVIRYRSTSLGHTTSSFSSATQMHWCDIENLFYYRIMSTWRLTWHPSNKSCSNGRHLVAHTPVYAGAWRYGLIQLLPIVIYARFLVYARFIYRTSSTELISWTMKRMSQSHSF